MTDKTTNNNGVIFKISVQYSDIKELIRTDKKETKILFNNGDILTFDNCIGKQVFKNLCRQFPGEHIE